MATDRKPYSMMTSPLTSMRVGPLRLTISEPFIIASRDRSTVDGTLVYPRLWRADDVHHIEWHFDRDRIDARLPLPGQPHGRMSVDGGRTWTLPPAWSPKVYPCGCKVGTAPGKAAAFWHTFPVEGEVGTYRMATWRSNDSGRNWGPMTWTTIRFPGTRAFDTYDPPDGFKQFSPDYKHEACNRIAPPWMQPLFDATGTRARGPHFHDIFADHAGVLHAISFTRYLPGGDAIPDDDAFWNRLDWSRHAVLEHISTDGGYTWEFRGVVAFDEQHLITEFDEGNCYAEPAMHLYPDGWGVCVMRVGSFRPLHFSYTIDHGKTWTRSEPLDIRGVDPHLVALPGGLLVLATGRPDCTLHVSLDRGRTWAVSETLFSMPRGNTEVFDRYINSTCNTGLSVVDDGTLLYVHDASRTDADESEPWLRRSGFTRVVGRRIHIERATPGDARSMQESLSTLRPHKPTGPPGSTRTVEAVCRDGVDLRSEVSWAMLPAHTLVNVETGRPMRGAASVRLAWADEALHLRIDCPDPDVATLRAMAARCEDDRAFWEGENVELLIRTPVHSYYQITIGPSGRHMDFDRARGVDGRWKSQAQIIARIDDAGWSVWASLPVVSPAAASTDPLRGIAGEKPNPDKPWLINVCHQRVRAARHELSALVPTGEFGFHLPATFATLLLSCP